MEQTEITETKAPRYEFTHADRLRAVAVRMRNRANREAATAKVAHELRSEMISALGHEPSALEKCVFDSLLVIFTAVRTHADAQTNSAASRRELRAALKDARATLQTVASALRLLRMTADGNFERPLTDSEKREQYWARLNAAPVVADESERA